MITADVAEPARRRPNSVRGGRSVPRGQRRLVAARGGGGRRALRVAARFRRRDTVTVGRLDTIFSAAKGPLYDRLIARLDGK